MSLWKPFLIIYTGGITNMNDIEKIQKNSLSKRGNPWIIYILQIKKYLSGGFFWAVLGSGYLFPLILFVIYSRTHKDLTNYGYWEVSLKLIFEGYFAYYVVLVPLVLATAAFRDEFNDQNIIYILVKPIKRQYIFAMKYLAYLTTSTVVTLPPLLLTVLVANTYSLKKDPYFHEPSSTVLLNTALLVAGLFLMLIGYGVVFMTVSILVKRPLLINLILGFSAIFEVIFTDLINNNWEFLYIAINFISRYWQGFDSLDVFFRRQFLFGLSAINGIWHAIIIILVFFAIGMRKIPQKQLY